MRFSLPLGIGCRWPFWWQTSPLLGQFSQKICPRNTSSPFSPLRPALDLVFASHSVDNKVESWLLFFPLVSADLLTPLVIHAISVVFSDTVYLPPSPA